MEVTSAHGPIAATENLRDLRMRQTIELPQYEDQALAGGQPGQGSIDAVADLGRLQFTAGIGTGDESLGTIGKLAAKIEAYERS